VTHPSKDRSYRALFRVPTLGRVILSMQIARTAQSMLSVAIVLFTLAAYDSPGLAGIVTFALLFPGLLLSPIAGALLDRHGRVRLIVVDYAVALVSLVLIGSLALAGRLQEARSLLASGGAAEASPYQAATVHLALGEAERALELLAGAADRRDPWIILLAVDPMMKPLHGHPGYAALVRRVGGDR